MGTPPYSLGDRITVRLDGHEPRVAIVDSLIETTSLDPARRWRVICRWHDDDAVVDVPVHCDDDGHGPFVEPLLRDRLRDQDTRRPLSDEPS